MTAVTVAVLLGLGLAGTGTGISALITQQQGYNVLRASIDKDIEKLKKAISHLQESLSSLAEMVLQNRRGLDLLLLQQGGLCAALKEECCFFADHSGVVKDSLLKVREGLQQRKLQREKEQGWFSNWFSTSPWLATLLPTILGPLLGLLLVMYLGPVIFNKLMAFLCSQIEAIQAKPLQVHYQQLVMQDSSICTEALFYDDKAC